MKITSGVKGTVQYAEDETNSHKLTLGYGISFRGKRNKLLKELVDDDSLSLNPNPLRRKCYELWSEGELIGLCALPYAPLDYDAVEDEDDFVCVGASLEMVYLKAEYRNRGIGHQFAKLLASELEKLIVSNVLTKPSLHRNKLIVTLDAGFETHEGDAFFDTLHSYTEENVIEALSSFLPDIKVEFVKDAGF